MAERDLELARKRTAPNAVTRDGEHVRLVGPPFGVHIKWRAAIFIAGDLVMRPVRVEQVAAYR